MSTCVVAGIEITPTSVKRLPPERIGPPDSRAYNTGALNSTVRAEKDGWQIVTTLLLAADMDTLVAALAFGASVSCTGTVFGADRTCKGTVGERPSTAVASSDGNGFMDMVTLTLREV
jgi:hypothetical protein